MPDNDQLKKIRRTIADQPDRFLSIIRDKQFKTFFGKLEGDKLQRVPKGYEPDHAMAEWLKYKQFFVGVEWVESRCLNVKFVSEIAAVFEATTPLVRFLNEAMS